MFEREGLSMSGKSFVPEGAEKNIIKEIVVPKREPVFAEFPEVMLPEIKTYLSENAGISKLYCHQAEMFERCLAGENIVITTSTASGKTLSFLLPILNEILKNPLTRAVFVYPTKALASDQYRQRFMAKYLRLAAGLQIRKVQANFMLTMI
jgi:DEAD/DEAH box helicase domain-containing protein